MNPAELNDILLAAASELRTALEELERRSRDYADMESVYRKAKAVAYLHSAGTVGEREAEVSLETADLRAAALMADVLKVSSLEAVRSKRSVLSAIQTVANLTREELNLVRTGPQEGP
jgi:hypothetical protein